MPLRGVLSVSDQVDRSAFSAKDLPVGDDSMAQIRELLFGQQQRETAQRIDALGDRTRGALAESEQRLRLELERLGANGLDRQAEQQAALEQGLAQLQHQFDERIDALQAQLQKRMDDLEQDTDASLKRLRSDKLDRRQLTGLLRQLAEQIDNDE